MKIKAIQAKEILDSRGKPTIEVEAKSEGSFVKAGVPSGASTGKGEAKPVEVSLAIKNVNEIIGPQLVGKDPLRQKEIDDFLIDLDGKEDKSNLGANAIVGVSMAVAKLAAVVQKVSLWHHLSQITEDIPPYILPLGCFNILNGGAHANNDLDIQEFMIVPTSGTSQDKMGKPQKESFSRDFQIAKDVYQNLEILLKGKFGDVKRGDEGGFAPLMSSTKKALDLILEAITRTVPVSIVVKIILDCAVSQFQEGDKYQLEGEVLTKEKLLNFYQGLISEYPIVGLEDPFGENDWQGFQLIFKELGDKITIIGDDLLVTNVKRIKEAAEKTACNGAIIKINQIGTVSEAIEAVKLAKSFGWKIIVSHRSGETEDDFIADFAVGVGADFIKSGAPATPFRLAKYNRLLEIEKEISQY